jgi:hypothetical protein
LLLGYRVHTLLCRGTGLPLLFRLSSGDVHNAPFARPLLELAVRLFALQPRVVRLNAGYWGLKLIAWIHTALGAQAVIPWNAKRQKRRDGLPPTWTAAELGKRTSIERFFGRVLVFFRLQRPPVFGWSAVETQVTLTSSAHKGSSWPMSGKAWSYETPSAIIIRDKNKRRRYYHVVLLKISSTTLNCAHSSILATSVMQPPIGVDSLILLARACRSRSSA